MRHITHYFTDNFKFNDGVNDGKVILKYDDQIIINVHKEILLLTSEYFKDIHKYDCKIPNENNNIFLLLASNSESFITINLPIFHNDKSKIPIIEATLILFNLLYNSNYNVTNNTMYKSATVYVFVHEIADFLLLNDKSMQLLVPYDNIIINNISWALENDSVFRLLNLLSSISSKQTYIIN
jgi:hypothetical protein